MRIGAWLVASTVFFAGQTAHAQAVGVSVGGHIVSNSSWFVPIGKVFQADIDVEVLPTIFVGGHAEYFDVGSSSSDHASYDREVLSGWGLGPTLRMVFRPYDWLEPYVTLRAQIQGGTRGYPYEETHHLTLTPGAEFGANLSFGVFRGGLFYAADFPTADFDDFGGIRYNLLFPGLRLGLAF